MYEQGAQMLVDRCAGVRAGERVYIITDATTEPVARYVEAAARQQTDHVRLEVIPDAAMHGAEPPAGAEANFAWGDVIFGMTQMSMAHTRARQRATERGARYLSLPDYSLPLLERASLFVDFARIRPVAAAIGSLLEDAGSAHVTSAHGTDLRIGFPGRAANVCPGTALEPGSLGSPPDAEVNIAPVETTTTGIAWIDGSIPCREIGLLHAPVGLRFEAGRVVEVCGDSPLTATVRDMFASVGDPGAFVLGEFGVGLNPASELSGSMLEDEGALGTIHLGIGSNATIGGTNHVPFHLDFIMRRPTVTAGEQQLMAEGVITYPPDAARVLHEAATQRA